MERSQSQKVIRILSIINIIGAVLFIILGFMVIAGGALAGASGGSEIVAEGITAAEAGGLVSIGGIVFVVIGIIEMLIGILGIRASNDASKIMPVWWLSLISLVMQVAGLVATFVQGGGTNGIIGTIASIAVAALMFWAANNVKAEAGK